MGGIRVVLADDTADVRMLLRSTLQLDGRFEVVGEADDGHAVIQLAGDTRPDAVVLDLSMPALHALDAIPRLRDTAPEARIVVLSAFDSTHMAQEALARGATAFLEKATAFAELGDVLAGLCQPEPGQPQAATGAAGATESEVISLLVHELQNPITVIQGLAATLRASMDRMDEEVVQSSVAAIERNARNLGSLVRTLADAEALEAGELRLRRERVDVGALVREAICDLDVLSGGHPVDARIGDAVAHVDPVRVIQVLGNLLSNAAKFSPLGAPITVALTTTTDRIELTIDDEGPGVPVDREGELFQKFSRLGSMAKGTGLGLFISRGIARAHGGDLVHERRPGGGARFRLSLPR